MYTFNSAELRAPITIFNEQTCSSFDLDLINECAIFADQ